MECSKDAFIMECGYGTAGTIRWTCSVFKISHFIPFTSKYICLLSTKDHCLINLLPIHVWDVKRNIALILPRHEDINGLDVRDWRKRFLTVCMLCWQCKQTEMKFLWHKWQDVEIQFQIKINTGSCQFYDCCGIFLVLEMLKLWLKKVWKWLMEE